MRVCLSRGQIETTFRGKRFYSESMSDRVLVYFTAGGGISPGHQCPLEHRRTCDSSGMYQSVQRSSETQRSIRTRSWDIIQVHVNCGWTRDEAQTSQLLTPACPLGLSGLEDRQTTRRQAASNTDRRERHRGNGRCCFLCELIQLAPTRPVVTVTPAHVTDVDSSGEQTVQQRTHGPGFLQFTNTALLRVPINGDFLREHRAERTRPAGEVLLPEASAQAPARDTEPSAGRS